MEAKTSNNATSVKCAWCAGTRKWNVAPGNYVFCIVCGGNGQVSVSGQPVACQQCYGSGRSNSVSPCFTCGGTGWEKVEGQ
jgi:DnaJ-class molecular chaperone